MVMVAEARNTPRFFSNDSPISCFPSHQQTIVFMVKN